MAANQVSFDDAVDAYIHYLEDNYGLDCAQDFMNSVEDDKDMVVDHLRQIVKAYDEEEQ